MKLSVVLATHNEEANLARCLESVKEIADEIIIVDGASTDRSVEIAKEYKAQIIKTTNKKNFHINKQMALEAAQGAWILQLDADEVVTKALQKDIKAVLDENYRGVQDKLKQRLFYRHQEATTGRSQKLSDDIHGYFIPRLNMFMGQPLRYGGVYPDGAIRLVRNGKARFPQKSVHEYIEVDGAVDWLEHDLLHFDSPTFARYIQRANRYTDLTASKLAKDEEVISVLNDIYYLVIKPKLVFLNLYCRHKGYKDGFVGLVWALFSALHWPLAYMKLRDLKKNA